MKHAFFLLLALALLYAPPTQACGPDGNSPEKLARRQRQAFERFDQNGDGFLSEEEFALSLQTVCRIGATEKVECRLPKGVVPREELKKLDIDGSDSLSFQEWASVNPPENFLLKCGL